jgi:acyl carrier protein
MSNTGPAPKVKEDIKDFLAQNLLYSADGFPYAEDASLLREGIIDSLGVVELVEFVQKRFAFKVDQQDVVPENFDSVARIAAYVSRKTETS